MAVGAEKFVLEEERLREMVESVIQQMRTKYPQEKSEEIVGVLRCSARGFIIGMHDQYIGAVDYVEEKRTCWTEDKAQEQGLKNELRLMSYGTLKTLRNVAVELDACAQIQGNNGEYRPEMYLYRLLGSLIARCMAEYHQEKLKNCRGLENNERFRTSVPHNLGEKGFGIYFKTIDERLGTKGYEEMVKKRIEEKGAERPL